MLAIRTQSSVADFLTPDVLGTIAELASSCSAQAARLGLHSSDVERLIRKM
jgi:DNA-binding MarR family transcriptional regulator